MIHLAACSSSLPFDTLSSSSHLDRISTCLNHTISIRIALATRRLRIRLIAPIAQGIQIRITKQLIPTSRLIHLSIFQQQRPQSLRIQIVSSTDFYFTISGSLHLLAEVLEASLADDEFLEAAFGAS